MSLARFGLTGKIKILMSVIDDIQETAESPAENMEEEVKSRGEARKKRDADYLNNVVSRNSDFVKRILTQVSPGSPEGTSAALSLWRWVPKNTGDNVTVTPQPVKTEETPVREYRFIINNAEYSKSEQFTVRSTFGESEDTVMSFGQSPRIWNFSGVLRKGDTLGRNNWWQAMEQLYMSRLRASILMRRNEFVQFNVGKMKMRGYILNLRTSQNAKTSDAIAQFGFSMYIRSYRFSDGYSYKPASDILSEVQGDPITSQEDYVAPPAEQVQPNQSNQSIA